MATAAWLPRYADTGNVVAGCRAWPICRRCGLRIPPEPGELIVACSCETPEPR